MFVTVPERYEASITTLENNKDLTKITLAELIHALHSQEQLRLMRQEGFVEGVLQAQVDWKNKKNPSKPITYSSVTNQVHNKLKNPQKDFSSCMYSGKGYSPFKC